MKTMFLGFLALAIISVGLYSQADQEPQSDEASLQPIVVNPIASKDSVPLVEIIEATCKTTPKRLEGCSCRVRNNSDREITALALVWTVTWSNGHSEHSDSFYESMDALIVEGLRPLAPGKAISFHSSRSTWVQGDESIKSVQVSIDYVEFADKSIIGPDISGHSRRITLTRQGAVSYKESLVRVYKEYGVEACIEKLMRNELTSESGLGQEASINSGAFLTQHGAKIYKNWLTSIYKKQGPDAVIEKLLMRVGEQPK